MNNIFFDKPKNYGTTITVNDKHYHCVGMGNVASLLLDSLIDAIDSGVLDVVIGDEVLNGAVHFQLSKQGKLVINGDEHNVTLHEFATKAYQQFIEDAAFWNPLSEPSETPNEMYEPSEEYTKFISLCSQVMMKVHLTPPSEPDIIFLGREHKLFYDKMLPLCREQDCYHKALIYCIGLNEITRNNVAQIYNLNTGAINTECLHAAWQTSTSLKIIRLAFNLYTDSTLSIELYTTHEEQMSELKEYTVSNLFCELSNYFMQAIKIRYPAYFQY